MTSSLLATKYTLNQIVINDLTSIFSLQMIFLPMKFPHYKVNLMKNFVLFAKLKQTRLGTLASKSQKRIKKGSRIYRDLSKINENNIIQR